MKIKEVCSLTGLTARRIRYYIEEQLITPDYTENYLGRRSYIFSEKDVSTLNEIVIYRKFGFSISDIKTIKDDPTASGRIISQLKAQKRKNIANETVLLNVLEQLDDRNYSFSELAELLSKPALNVNAPVEKDKLHFRRIIFAIISTIVYVIVAVVPLIFAFSYIVHYAYPKLSNDLRLGSVIFLFLALVPTLIIIVLVVFKNRIKKKIIRIVTLVIAILWLPLSLIWSAFGIPSCSETTKIIHYREFDKGCLANRSSKFQELFPVWYESPQITVLQDDGTYTTVERDVRYYYHYFEGMDYTYDIYAEWPLEKDKFTEEVNRVRMLYQEWADNSKVPYIEVKKGSYNCLFWYYYGFPPFEPVDNNYTYYIFAYDEENIRVRYIMCDSLENGVDQPYYLQLDW